MVPAPARAAAPAEARPMSAREASNFGANTEKLQKMEQSKKLDNTKVKEAQERGAKLREHKQQNPDNNDPRSFFDEQRKESAKPLHEVERKALEGYREKPGDPNPPKEVQQVLDFDAYVKVERSEEAYKKAGLDPKVAHTQALKDAGITGDTANNISADQQYSQIRDGVMDNLLNQPAVQALIPEVTEFTDQADKRDYVDAVIASDENVRLEVMRRGHSVAEKAMKLPRADASTEQKSAIDKAQEARIAAVNKRLGLNKNPLKQDDLQDILDQGEAGIKSAMYRKSLEEQNVKEPAIAESYLVNRDDLAAKEAALQKTPDGPDKTRLEQEIAKLKTSIQVAESTLGIKDDAGRLALAQKDAKAFAAVYGTKTRDGSMSGGMDRMAHDMVEAARQQQTLETQASANPTPEQEKARIDLQAEAAKAVGEGAFEGKDKSDQEARVIDARKMQAEADKLEKQGKHEAAQAVDQLQRQMDEDWAKFDEKGNKLSNKPKLGEDAKVYCRGNRETGIRRIIMGKIFGEGAKITIINSAGAEQVLTLTNGVLNDENGPYHLDIVVKDAKGNQIKRNEVATLENIPLTLIAGQSKEVIDTLYTSHGSEVEKRLITDYHFALNNNRKGDKGSAWNLRLTDDEKIQMEFNAKDIIDEVARSSDKAKELLNEYKKSGMNLGGIGLLLMLLGSLFEKKKPGFIT